MFVPAGGNRHRWPGHYPGRDTIDAHQQSWSYDPTYLLRRRAMKRLAVTEITVATSCELRTTKLLSGTKSWSPERSGVSVMFVLIDRFSLMRTPFRTSSTWC